MANRNEREVGIRLSVKDSDVAKRALNAFGAEGQATLKKIEQATTPANKGLLNLSNLIHRGRQASNEFASEATRSFLAPVAAITSAVGVITLLTNAIERVRKIADQGDLAERIGVDISTLQGLQATVRESGDDVETLNSSLETFATNLGKAVQEGGPLKEVFDLNGAKISGDTLTDLKTFADLVKNTSNEQDRLRLVTLGVGKAGKEMVELLSGGAAGIARAADEMERLGGGLTDEDVQQAAEMTKQLAEVGVKLDGARDRFSMLIAPAVLVALDELNTDLEKTSQLLTDIQNGNWDKVFSSLISFKYDPEQTLWARIGKLINGAQSTGPKFGNLGGDPGLPDPRNPLVVTVNGGTQEGSTSRSTFDFRSFFGNSAGSGATKLPSAGDAEAAAAAKRIQDVTDALKLQLSQLGMTNREVEISNQLSRAKVDASTAEGKAIADLTGELYDQQQALDAVNEATSYVASSLENVFEQMIDGGSSASEIILDLAKSLAKAVLQANLLGEGSLAGLFGTKSDTSGETGGLLGSLVSGVMSLFQQNALGGVYSGAGISAYSGTVVSKPTVFPFANGIGLMGEAGEEGILPLKRTKSGALGVQTSGGSEQSASPQMKVDVHNYGDASVDVRQNGQSLEVIIDKTVSKLGGKPGSSTSRMLAARGATRKLTRRG